MLSKSNQPSASRRSVTAFTLVELLVVIGIIALLIALLVPGLSVARQAAQRTACAERLHQMMIAASIHANEHKGFYPLVGCLVGANGDIIPPDIDDTYTSHYEYFGDPIAGTSDTRCLEPITFALATEMGFTKQVLAASSDAQQARLETDSTGLIRNFLCPSHYSYVSDMPICWLYVGQASNAETIGYTESLSYIFNEAVLGYDDQYGRLRGQVSRIRQPAQTMFAADGVGGSPYSRPLNFIDYNLIPPAYPGYLTFYNNQATPPITLSDVLTARAGGPQHMLLGGDVQSFDRLRHRGRMNIAFCDGHVETRIIPVLRTDPMARSFMNIFLLAP